MEISVVKINPCDVKVDVLFVPVYEDKNSVPECLSEIYDYAKNEQTLKV